MAKKKQHDRHVDMATEAEISKLRACLELSDDAISSLVKLGPSGIQNFRRQLEAAVQARQQEGFKRLAKWATWLPTKYLGSLAASAFGPRLSAKLVSAMNPVTGSRVAKRMEPAFLAEAATLADPRKVREIIPLIPAGLIRDVALILIEKGDFVVLGRFADALSAPAIRLVVNAIEDDGLLLKIAHYMEEPQQLNDIVLMLDNDRVARIIQMGMQKDLWPQALWVIDHVRPELRGRLANIMGAQDDALLNDLVDVAHKRRLWGPILRGLSAMNPRYYRKIVNLPALKDHALLGDLVRAAHDEGLFAIALPLARVMRPAYQKVVAEAALQQGDEVAEAALWAAHNSHRWDVILDLARHLDDEHRDTLARLPIARNRQALRSLMETASGTGHMGMLLDYVRRLDEDGHRLLVDIGLEDGGDLIEAIVDAARDTEIGWSALATALAAVSNEDTLKQVGLIYRRQEDEDQASIREAAANEGIWDRIAPLLEAA